MHNTTCLHRHGLHYLRHRLKIWRLPRVVRLFSISQRRTENVETHTVYCGSSGSITVDIHNNGGLPLTSPLILYLPPGPPELTQHLPAIPEALKPFRTARINYRWFNDLSKKRRYSYFNPLPANHPFPTPIHDILHAYTYLTTKPLPSLFPPGDKDASALAPTRKFYIYGSHLSGSLATSLALTESVYDFRNPILGLIAKNSIFNWGPITIDPPPETSAIHKTSKHSQVVPNVDLTAPWTISNLCSLRRFLFPTPVQCFDVFASPILFFRTPGIKVPRTWPEDKTGKKNSQLDPYEAIMNFEEVEEGEEKDQSTGSRYSYLRFPPRNTKLKIPRSLILVGTPHSSPSPLFIEPEKPSSSSAYQTPTIINDDSEIAGDVSVEQVTPLSQAHEMASLMQRSIGKYEFEDRSSWGEDLDINEVVGSRVKLFGIDPSGKGEQEEGDLIREWIEEQL